MRTKTSLQEWFFTFHLLTNGSSVSKGRICGGKSDRRKKGDCVTTSRYLCDRSDFSCVARANRA